jgi:hypothetical protein
MPYADAMKNQVEFAQSALDRAAIRNHGVPPAPQPTSVTTADTPTSGAVGGERNPVLSGVTK